MKAPALRPSRGSFSLTDTQEKTGLGNYFVVSGVEVPFAASCCKLPCCGFAWNV